MFRDHDRHFSTRSSDSVEPATHDGRLKTVIVYTSGTPYTAKSRCTTAAGGTSQLSMRGAEKSSNRPRKEDA